MDFKAKQNLDGGWGYGRGAQSWTEPTAMVLLAQCTVGADGESIRRGAEFLRGLQRRDGGWSPQEAVAESTWVTAVTALLPESLIGPERIAGARNWLLGQTGMESGWRWKLNQRLQGNHDEFPDGWAWFPGAAAWVIPTSFGVLAFEKALRLRDDRRIRERVEAGRQFLLLHICADGGWNHGGNRALGRDGDSYPETTGIALLALHGARGGPQVERAKNAARRHLAQCRTAEGTAWLRMGLAAHGEKSTATNPVVCRSTMDEALVTLANAERNPLCS